MRIYISGPITGTDDFEIRFYRTERELKTIGLDVINPAKVCSTLPELTHDEYMAICIPMLRMCDAIYLMEGWNLSKGAKQELAEAIYRDIRIITQLRSINRKDYEEDQDENQSRV